MCEKSLLERYKKTMDHIGLKNLTALPDEVKAALKNTTALGDKVKLLESIELNLERQGLV